MQASMTSICLGMSVMASSLLATLIRQVQADSQQTQLQLAKIIEKIHDHQAKQLCQCVFQRSSALLKAVTELTDPKGRAMASKNT